MCKEFFVYFMIRCNTTLDLVMPVKNIYHFKKDMLIRRSVKHMVNREMKSTSTCLEEVCKFASGLCGRMTAKKEFGIL